MHPSLFIGGRETRATWRLAMSANTWGEIPTTLLSSIDPKNSLTHNPNYPSVAPWNRTASGNVNKPSVDAVMVAYCGGAFDDATGTFWLPLGGGHADSGDNASYKINLNVESPSWSMVRPPSGSTTLIAGGLPSGSTAQGSSFLLDDGQETSGVYADGRPRAIHSYRKHVYLPGVGPIMAVQGGTFTSVGESTKKTWSMDESTGEWTHHSTADAMTYVGGSSGGSACLDTTRNKVLWLGAGTGSRLYRLDHTAWAWSQVSADTNAATGDVSITYIHEHDIVFEVCAYFSNGFCVRDAATGAITYPSVTGTPPTMDAAYGHAWVPDVGMVFCVGKTLYKLTPTGNAKTDAWAWSVLAADNASLPTDTGSKSSGGTGGMYSKFGYSARLGGLYRFTNYTDKPWFYATE